MADQGTSDAYWAVPLDGPPLPRYEGPYDVPVLVDDCKELGDFQMTRAVFFAIEASAAVDDWSALLTQYQIPFLLMGFTPVLHRPTLDRPRFADYGELDALINPIEQIQGVLVETDFIWLPNAVFGSCLPERGEAFRVGFRLFRTALRFRQEQITAEEFIRQALEAVDANPSLLTESPAEAEVFREWSRSQIEESRRIYKRRKEGEGPPVLPRRPKAKEST